MALPNEHQHTFNQYVDAHSMLQKLVSRLAILGVDTPPEDLNVKFLRSLPSEWDTHVVVWMNKPDFETMGLDDLYKTILKLLNKRLRELLDAKHMMIKNWPFLTFQFQPVLILLILLTLELVLATPRVTKNNLMGLLKTELEKVKEEKEGFEFKIAKFKKSSKDLDKLLASQRTDKSKKGFGYNAVPSPHPLILNRPTPLDLSYSGLEEFKQPEIPYSTPIESYEDTNDSLKQQHKTVTETSFVKSSLTVDKDWKAHVKTREKGIKREYSVARTPQQNGVAERKNKTLIEAARTMLTDSKLPTMKTKRVSQALRDQAWVEAMRRKLPSFKLQRNLRHKRIFPGYAIIYGIYGLSNGESKVLSCMVRVDERIKHPELVHDEDIAKTLRIFLVSTLIGRSPSQGFWYSKDSSIGNLPVRVSSIGMLHPNAHKSLLVFVKFLESANYSTAENGEVKITATIDGHSMTITGGSFGYQTIDNRIEVLEDDLKKTKQTYSSAFTKLILRVKKLEAQVKIGKARRRARIVHSDDEDIADDSSKQGRILSDAEVQDDWQDNRNLTSDSRCDSYRSDSRSTNTKSSEELVTYTRRSAEKRSRQDKGKAIMIESEPKKKIARDEEIAKQWDEEERQRAMAEAKTSKKIDWNDPSVIRYHTQKMKPKTVAQARKNMIKYLKNQGN
ncbi:ribonuclease H-like domain-containing protein [Tanacetum coccineum]